MTDLKLPAQATPPVHTQPIGPLRRLATWPARMYIRHSPTRRGKGYLTRRVLRPLLPSPPAGFPAVLPGGGRVMLYYRETIGTRFFVSGGFESAEINVLRSYAQPGTVVIDAGANIGLFTIPLAEAVGIHGSVFAFEPHPANIARLRDNIELNNLPNVSVFALAVADHDDDLTLYLSDDPAYCSTTGVKQNHGTGESLIVHSIRIDRVWSNFGRPDVSVLKIDVEGGELAVLKGSEELLKCRRPVLLIEADNESQLEELSNWLSGYGYTRISASALMPWNHIFIQEGARP